MLLINYFPIFMFLTLLSEILGNEAISDAIPSDWIGRQPHKTLIINEGDPIEISCLTDKPAIFYYALGKLSSSFNISQEKKDSKFILHTFRRPKALRGDTYFYSCFAVNDTSINLDYVNSEFIIENNKPLNLTYIYVRSKKYAFTTRQPRNVYSWAEGNYMRIFCRTTSPDIHVDLEYHSRGNRKVITTDKRVFWDPKFGFIVQDMQTVDDGLYICKAKHNGHSQEILYSISIDSDSIFNNPSIRSNEESIIRGNTINLNCTIILNNITKYELNWITPRKNDKVTMKMDSSKSDIGMVLTNQLSIINFTENDEGDYKCILVNLDKSEPEIKSINKYLKISDPKLSYINITYNRAEKDFVRYTGDDLYIIAMVDAFPRPEVQWLNPKGEEIQTSEKFFAINHYFYPRLIIENIELTDAGVYTLRVSNEIGTKVMKYTLEVKTS